MSAQSPPSWSWCAHGADPATDPVGCIGVLVPGHTACLAHLSEADRDAYLAGLTAGAHIDHRGTTFTQPLLDSLLAALQDPVNGKPRIGAASFESATFEGHARFNSVTFQHPASFESATFQGDASFGLANFQNHASFESATFQDQAWFESATFDGIASFESATFQDRASFKRVTSTGRASFESTTFEGYAWFESATFEGTASFSSATFQDTTWFSLATFRDLAWFESVTFMEHVSFNSVTFQELASFGSATFQDTAWFESATFDTAWFGSATFQDTAWFSSATFEGVSQFGLATFQNHAWFGSATFRGDTRFESAIFERDAHFQQSAFEGQVTLGPFVCAGRVRLSGAVFSGPATLSFAARRLECHRTRWASVAELRLRYATVDFSHAVFEYPLTIAAETHPFVLSEGEPLAEQALSGAPGAMVRIASLRGVDAAHLVLADVDLSGCLFTGTVHLDQVRLEGTCTFDTVPSDTHWRHWWRPVRFTQRHVLAEEHHWRASQPTAVQGWNVAVFGASNVGPAQLAPVYRALRKAFEDSKNEPGAADFYYGEMEMRRHDRTGTPRAERGLLHGYWMLSGYGLRALRALGWLAACMLVTIVLLMGFGLPKDDPKQEATGTVPPGGGKVTFEIEKDDPQNPTGDRFTGKRFEKALNVTLNSVVFRSSGQDLTTSGTYIEMASRLLEPALLALAVLAVRGRIKR
ncbi:pentapeptide repeat-containing protein [Streptomyces sp. NPDC127063]|uniref:pentapeptide repeat-containing protein n=1 Tax=Streptomyces sp. NPDC127063 TaxID=3347123 RepID=UPI003650C7CA